MTINQQALSFFTVNGQQVPAEGPRVVPVLLDFSIVTEYDLNIQNMQARNFISMVQSVFLDNSAGNTPFTVAIPGSGQKIIQSPGRQGYYQVLMPNPAQIVFSSQSGSVLRAFLLNFPSTNSDWPTFTGA